jgi:DNA-nicking Smr family endonuclease
MGIPRVRDDLTTLEVDFHSCTVEEALALLPKTFALARDRGRSNLVIIHGSSTSDPLARNRTIKHVVQDWLSARFPGQVVFEDTRTRVAFLGGSPDRRQIRLGDLM